MKPLHERISDIRHLRMDLSADGVSLDTPPHRPELQVFASMDEGDAQPVITLNMGALFGQAQRFADMHPLEARKLADMLIEMTRKVEGELFLEHGAADLQSETARIILEIRAAPASHTDAFAANDQREYDDERQWGWSVT